MAQQESWKRDKEGAGCQPPEGPVLCANGCGFFGSAATLNLCSKCYRDYLLKQSKSSSSSAGKITAAVEKSLFSTSTHSADVLVGRTGHFADQSGSEAALAVPHVPSATPSDGGTSSATAAKDQGQAQQQTVAPNRCSSCKKRVGLTGFKCRCGNTFCSTHRYSDKHSCTYDHKSAGRDAIAKANPVVKADKIQKI